MKGFKIIVLILVPILMFTQCKYEDGPIMSFRSKKNRVAHRIGKYWKSELYELKMGQEGYALSKLGVEGFIDIGDWEFDGTKHNIIFTSETFPDFEMRIIQLMNKKMKLEGAFPYDNAPIVHEFTRDKTIDELDK